MHEILFNVAIDEKQKIKKNITIEVADKINIMIRIYFYFFKEER